MLAYAACYKHIWIFIIRQFSGTLMIERHEFGQASGSGEEVGIKCSRTGMVLCRARPLQASFLKTSVTDAAVNGRQARDLVHDLRRWR